MAVFFNIAEWVHDAGLIPSWTRSSLEVPSIPISLWWRGAKMKKTGPRCTGKRRCGRKAELGQRTSACLSGLLSNFLTAGIYGTHWQCVCTVWQRGQPTAAIRYSCAQVIEVWVGLRVPTWITSHLHATWGTFRVFLPFCFFKKVWLKEHLLRVQSQASSILYPEWSIGLTWSI